PNAFQSDLAESLHNLGVDLNNLLQREAALEVTREAVVLRRRLAERNPDVFRPTLIVSLHNLHMILSGLGEQGLALAACREAVALQQLAGPSHDAFQPDRTMSLQSLLTNRGRTALDATREAKHRR